MAFPAPQIVININIIKVNSFENASAINVGQNVLADWHNSDKKTMGLGQNMGDCSNFVGTRSFVDDRDQIDAPSLFESGPLPIPLTKE
ncbi:hypothetical protein J31TS4_34740 [Paenibacillus sp. J31TS4]|uniref:hypothetical protein n=1 Tax=Paenibacillus sp. J31TS4 TaxID=2807195 RepID=UPI001B013487|nr:hypothetical protein [Paenibacillus sp. J31TS4]GIP40194.1 hypothetical protein J31TS4_34740 [Paenibacillus sp. J31TS4]